MKEKKGEQLLNSHTALGRGRGVGACLYHLLQSLKTSVIEQIVEEVLFLQGTHTHTYTQHH